MGEQDQGVAFGPGSQASPEAAEASSPSVSIPNAAAMWRNGVGVTVEAVDRLRANVAKRKRLSPSLKAFDDELDAILELCSSGCRQHDPQNYGQANAASKAINARVAQAIEARRAATGTGAVEDESAVGNANVPKVSTP